MEANVISTLSKIVHIPPSLQQYPVDIRKRYLRNANEKQYCGVNMPEEAFVKQNSYISSQAILDTSMCP